jgi:TrmH family RNA methyltransferase
LKHGFVRKSYLYSEIKAMSEKITSLSNPKVKNLVKLGKGRGKDRKENFIFEGLKEIELALQSGIEILSVFYCEEIAPEKDLLQVLASIPQSKQIQITPEIFAKVAYRDTTGGILFLANTRYLTFSEVRLPENPLVLVLESVEKPGNLGGILRTADAAGVDLVIVCDPLTDLYNPNIIRNSLGCIFTVPVVVCRSEEALAYLRFNNIRVLVTDLQHSQNYHQIDYRLPSAIVMGTEHSGTSPFWLHAADLRIKIPMLGKIDSLNVSTSTAVLVYEAVRQRD